MGFESFKAPSGKVGSENLSISVLLGIITMGLGYIFIFKKKFNIFVATSKPRKKYDHLVVGKMNNTETLLT